MAPPRSDMGPFLPYILVSLQASTWGCCPPQPVPLLGHNTPPPCPSSYWLARSSFEPNLYLYKYPSNLISVILLVQWLMKMEQGVPKYRYLKFRRRGSTQKKEYKILWFIFWNIVYTLLRNHGLILRRSKKYFSWKAQINWGTLSAMYPVGTRAPSPCIEWLAPSSA